MPSPCTSYVENEIEMELFFTNYVINPMNILALL